MDAKTNGDLPAAPRPRWRPTDGHPNWDGHAQGGLTKREAFAMAAMQGLIAHNCDHFTKRDLFEDGVAKRAVLQADALLAELAK